MNLDVVSHVVGIPMDMANDLSYFAVKTAVSRSLGQREWSNYVVVPVGLFARVRSVSVLYADFFVDVLLPTDY